MPRGAVTAPVKCGKCGTVTVFVITPPTSGKKDFQFTCPTGGHDMADESGAYRVVHLKDYDASTLRRVVL